MKLYIQIADEPPVKWLEVVVDTALPQRARLIILSDVQEQLSAIAELSGKGFGHKLHDLPVTARDSEGNVVYKGKYTFQWDM